MSKNRGVIFAIFFVSLVISLGILLYMSYQGMFYSDTGQKLILQVISLYTTHLGAIIGGIFVRSKITAKTSKNIFYIALVLSIAWNTIVVYRVLAYAIKPEDPKYVIEFLSTVPSALSFLVAGVIAYYFAKD